MRRTLTLVFIVQLMFGVVAGWALGGMLGNTAPEITVGDWFNSAPRTLKSLRGKIIVLEFWATWCPPCKASIPHLNKLNEEYKDKGVVIIGITQESKGKVESFMKRMPMEYIVGAKGGNTSQTYGVRGIPHAFVIDPKGIIRWNGHPMGGLDDAIKKQLKETPPILLSRKALKATEGFIAEAEKALEKDNYLVAIEKAQKVKENEKVPVEIRVKADVVLGKIMVRGEKELAEAKEFLKAEAYVAANKILARVQRTYVGLPVSEKAAELLENMNKNPKISEAINSADKENKARRLLFLTEKVYAAKQYREALKQYDSIQKQYAGTNAAKTAKEKAVTIRSDSGIMKAIEMQVAEKACRRMFNMAETYAANQKPDKARTYLQEIITEYPDTPFAEEAKKKLEKL